MSNPYLDGGHSHDNDANLGQPSLNGGVLTIPGAGAVDLSPLANSGGQTIIIKDVFGQPIT